MRDTSAYSWSPGVTNPPALQAVADNANAELRAAKKGKAPAASKASASLEAVSVLNWSAAIVIGSLVALWLLGGIVFKNANL